MPAAIVLAGGEGRRLGGVSKPDVTVGGRRMLDLVLDALAGAHPRVVVASDAVEVPAGVLRTLEDPPLGGPAAGIAAGLRALDGGANRTLGNEGSATPDTAPNRTLDDEVLVLACDLPGAAAVVATLEAAGPLPDGVDGVVLERPDGRREWLALRARTASLRRAVTELGFPHDRSVRDLLAPLVLAGVPAPGAQADDVDTPADRRTWERRARGSGRPPVTEQEDWDTHLRPWLEAACRELGLSTAGEAPLVDPAGDVDTVHVLTGEVAEGVQRSMAPVSSYLVGIAVGRGAALPDAIDAVRRTLERS
ncbi:NTP transferase domain-containing protein [Georgenia sp. Z1344]|uniref:NTP transferase domain-containing protein n=1 Tax=Georgenia sp. Z1344 TaxID=3416706 RepID=UPI003CEB894E